MRVYWSDREQRPAPKNAQFGCIPFFSDCTPPFPPPQELIANLPPPTTIQVVKRQYLPTKETWIASIQACRKKKIEKVVLARCELLELAAVPNPFALTAALQLKAQGSYVFCFSKPSFAFFGATPERLFFRDGDQLLSEAMAGTISRGKTKNEDKKLGASLLKCEKSLRELSPVQTFLHHALTPLCMSPPIFSTLTLHRTQNVQHLYTQCRARLRTNVSNQQILDQIHPTPALCGTPSDEALALIRELEPFNRRLYGGAFGWQTDTTSEWIVGIRSCCIQGRFAYLYAGAGIVAGSDPEQEWEELNQKTKLYEGIFL